MVNKNINSYDTDDERQRYAYSMLPTHLLMKGVLTPAVKSVQLNLGDFDQAA